jgi:hypothetical protein
MNGDESAVICERVSRATARMLTLNGSPHPYREFRDAMSVGAPIFYELIYVTPSLFSTVIETGVAAYCADNKLVRLNVVRSIHGKKAIRIDCASHGTFFVRVVSELAHNGGCVD